MFCKGRTADNRQQTTDRRQESTDPVARGLKPTALTALVGVTTAPLHDRTTSQSDASTTARFTSDASSRSEYSR